MLRNACKASYEKAGCPVGLAIGREHSELRLHSEAEQEPTTSSVRCPKITGTLTGTLTLTKKEGVSK